MGEIFRDLRVCAALLVADFCPAENRPEYVIEIVRDAAGKLPDGFEFLRLLQLAFQGSHFRHVLHDPFKAIGNTCIENTAYVEPNRDESAVAAPPFRLCIMDDRVFSRIGQKFRERFGVPKHVVRQIQSLHLGKTGTGQNLQQGFIDRAKRSVGSRSKCSIYRILHQFA